MNAPVKNKNGFTMIEIIVVMAIVGILATITIINAGRVLQGFLFTRMNAITTQKGHIAINRLTKEFTNINQVSSGNGTSITFRSNSYIDGSELTHTVSFAGSALFLDGDILTDNVNSFSLSYFDVFDSTQEATWSDTTNIIEITLSLNGANNTVSTFITRITPRNIVFQG